MIDNAGLEDEGVWLNPNVRVSYNLTTYPIVNPDFGEPPGKPWPAGLDMVTGIWGNRITRWLGWIKLWSESSVVKRRVRKWVKEGKKIGEKREEPGIECLVDEMQVLFHNGWQHV